MTTFQIVVAILLALFGGVITALGTVLLMYFKDMKNSVGSLNVNVGDLNLKMERVIAAQSWHKDEINEIKEEMKGIYERLNAQQQ